MLAQCVFMKNMVGIVMGKALRKHGVFILLDAMIWGFELLMH